MVSTLDITKSTREEAISNLIRVILTIGCIALYKRHIGFYDGCGLENRLAYSFCHANVFHLAANLLVLWCIKGRLSFCVPFSIAVLASFVPSNVGGVTMGLSGFLFAYFGIAWGRVRGRNLLKIYRPIGIILIMMFLPNINGYLHLYTFLIGFIFSVIRNSLRFRL